MNNNVKKISITQPIWKYKKVLEVCNEQSKKGYQLSKIKVLHRSVFKKDESKRYVYDMDFNPGIFINKKKKEVYSEMFKEQGWELVNNTFNGFSIYRKEYKEGTTDEEYKLYTDAKSTEELYKRMEGFIKFGIGLFVTLEMIGMLILAIANEYTLVEFLLTTLLLIIICAVPVFILSRGIKYIRNLKNNI